jgi:predicted nucleotidyltransferase
MSLDPTSSTKPNDTSADIDIRSLPFFQELTKLPYIDAIYVHGSRARGDHDINSDIDLAIMCPRASDEEWNHIVQLIHSAKLLVKVDLKRLDKVSPNFPFYKQIHETKSLLFYPAGKARINALKYALDHFEREMVTLEAHAKNSNGLNDEQQNQLLKEYFIKFDMLVRYKLRTALVVTGVRVHTPLDMLRLAFSSGWLENRTLWEDMFVSWEYAHETCAPEVRRDIIAKMQSYAVAMRALFEKLKDVERNARKFFDQSRMQNG